MSARETHGGLIAAVFCRRDDGMILQVHHPRYGWVMPSGKIEAGEAPRMAAVRELQEETGLDVGFARPIRVAPFVSEGYKVHLYVVYPGDLCGELRAEEGNPVEPRWGPVHELAPISLAGIAGALMVAGGML